MPAIKILATAISLICATVVTAGDLNAPSAPTDPGSAMHTLEDVYNRMTTGAAGTKRLGAFDEPGSAPAPTGHTLDEVMGKAPKEDNVTGVQPDGVLAGEKYWGLRTDGNWGLQTGEMQNNGIVIFTPGTGDQAVEGYYSTTSKVAGDADLVTGNIKSGASIFGVLGKPAVVDTTTGDALATDIATGKKAWVDGNEITGTASLATFPAVLSKTGQNQCYKTDGGTTIDCSGTGQDGELQKGVAQANPRFTVNNGTVTDNSTGLIWLQDANCAKNSGFDADGLITWAQAFSFISEVNAGTTNCSDTSNSGSNQSDWRLPNVKELQSLIDYQNSSPVLPSTNPFTSVVSSWYWSSTSFKPTLSNAWRVTLATGYVGAAPKGTTFSVWPVRGGQ